MSQDVDHVMTTVVCPLSSLSSTAVVGVLGDEARDARRVGAEMEREAHLLQAGVLRGEAVEAAQVVGPGLACEVLEIAPRRLHILEEAPRDRALSQPRAAALGHDRFELGPARG